MPTGWTTLHDVLEHIDGLNDVWVLGAVSLQLNLLLKTCYEIEMSIGRQ